MIAPSQTTKGERLAAAIGWSYLRIEGHDLIGPCPECTSSDAFHLHEDRGTCHCFSCGKSHSPQSFTEKLLGIAPAAAIQILVQVGLYQDRSNGHARNGRQLIDPLTNVAAVKGVSVDSLRAYGGCSSGNSVVFSMYGGDGKQCSTITLGADGGKGIYAKDKPHGLFLPHDDQGNVRVPKAGETWHIVEGVKDAAALHAQGLLAAGLPTSHMAAKFARLFRGVNVVVIPDRDKPGADGAVKTASVLFGVAASIRIATLPLPFKASKGQDVRDLLKLANGQELLAQCLADAPAWEPKEGEVIEQASDEDAGTTAPSKGISMPRALVVNMADVEPQSISWAWPNRIAQGKLTVVSGDPGLGKSFMTIDLAARTTNGAPWPDDPSTFAPLGSVVLLNAEDDLGDTVRPRLDAAGADVRKVVALQAIQGSDQGKNYDRQFDLTRDLERLEEAAIELGDCRLIIIDPISAYLGKTKSHDNAEVRGVLAPLSDMAGRLGVAVLAVSHLRKGDGPAMYRTMGSMAFVAAARAAYAVARDRDDPTGKRRLFLPIKNNIGNDHTGLAFELSCRHGSSGVPCVLWHPEPIGSSADDALATPDRARGPRAEEKPEAKEFLAEALAHGPRLARELIEEAREVNNLSKRTLDRAKQDLGIEAFRESVPGPWHWRLPTLPTLPNTSGTETHGNHGNLGNLAVLAGKTPGYQLVSSKVAKIATLNVCQTATPFDDVNDQLSTAAFLDS